MKTTLNQLETEITTVLDSCIIYLHQNKIYGDKNWTNCLKEGLAKLGSDKGNKICTSGFQDLYDSEWLFDMVWYKENNECKLIDVPLVIESEWGNKTDQIKFDFEKLLLSNSRNKLMICQCHESTYDGLIQYFEDAIQFYGLNKKDDRYLIAVLVNPEEKFYYEVIAKE